MNPSPDFTNEREEMVKSQLISRGITDSHTLGAMLQVPRHEFLPADMQAYSYMDGPVGIGEGQTISQPYIVALMNQMAEIKPSSKVLDIGTGSGYAAAVAAFTAKEVYSVERVATLSERAQFIFKKLGCKNIYCKIGDGTLGWKEHAPYDAVIVAAGTPGVPEQLLQQLNTGGVLVIPVGDRYSQVLMLYRKIGEDRFQIEAREPVRFVPLIGEQGWQESE